MECDSFLDNLSKVGGANILHRTDTCGSRLPRPTNTAPSETRGHNQANFCAKTT